MLNLQEALDDTKDPKETATHIETALEKWAVWKATARVGALGILQKHIFYYCDNYVTLVNVECGRADSIEPAGVEAYGKSLEQMEDFLDKLMATGLEGVYGKASAAKQVISSVKPKLTLATDRTSIAAVMTSLKGSDIASDKGSETLERIKNASANLETDLLREQQDQAIRALCEG